MRVPYEWLRELVEISAAPDEVSEKLTMIGLEVEGTESVQNEIVFEVNVTPNRPDCLSIIGVARELVAAFQTHLKMPPHGIEGKAAAVGIIPSKSLTKSSATDTQGV